MTKKQFNNMNALGNAETFVMFHNQMNAHQLKTVYNNAHALFTQYENEMYVNENIVEYYRNQYEMTLQIIIEHHFNGDIETALQFINE